MRSSALVVGLAGRTGAGKTTAAKYLSAKYELQYARYSRVLEEWFPHCGRRDRSRTIGWAVMSGGRQRELNSKLIETLDRPGRAVIDGLRHQIDVECLSESFGSAFHLIFLEADGNLRADRLRCRFAEPGEAERAEAAPVEGYADRLKGIADTVISNEGSLGTLYERLDTWAEPFRIVSRR